MIDLRRSRTRSAVVRELFGSPDTEIHVRALARVTNEAVANVHRELRRLESEGWVTTRRSGNRVLYRVDTENPLYPAVSRLVDETVGAAALLRGALAGMRGISLALLLASTAGPAGRELPLLIVGQFGAAEVTAALAPVGAMVHCQIHPLLFDRDGLLGRLRQRDERTVRLLEAPHTVLIGDEKAVRTLLAAARG